MGKLGIDTDYIAKLAELLERTGLTELEVSEGDAKVRVVKRPPRVVEVAQAPAVQAQPVATAALASAPAAAPSSSAGPDGVDLNHPGLVKSPMVGTVYLSPEPEAAHFAPEGSTVKEGQPLLIVEAMKVMNQVRAPRAGRVERVFCRDGTPVEYGEPLLLIV